MAVGKNEAVIGAAAVLLQGVARKATPIGLPSLFLSPSFSGVGGGEGQVELFWWKAGQQEYIGPV